MSLAIGVLITFLVVILVLYLVNMLPVDGRTRQIIRVIVIIIGVLLGFTGDMTPEEMQRRYTALCSGS